MFLTERPTVRGPSINEPMVEYSDANLAAAGFSTPTRVFPAGFCTSCDSREGGS